VLLVLAGFAIAPTSARAEFLLADAKKAGQVGEKRDGYLALIDQRAPDQIKEMVETTNVRRRQRYLEFSQKMGWTIDEAARAAAKRHFKHARPGELLEGAAGGWERKGGAPKPPPRKP